jgi:hypothetical protein
MRDILSLAAVSMRRNNQPTSYEIGNFGAVVATDKVQAKVDTRGASRRCQNGSLVDIEHLRIDVNLRKSRSENVGISPMSGGTLSVQ